MHVSTVIHIPKSRKLPFYCQKCGTECVVKRRFLHYSTGTGEPIFEIIVSCPNIETFWQRLFDTSFVSHAKDLFISLDYPEPVVAKKIPKKWGTRIPKD